jgi:hypothetical protein
MSWRAIRASIMEYLMQGRSKSCPARAALSAFLALWLLLLAGGMARLWKYESAAGAPAQAPNQWPAETRINRTAGLPTLIILMHPHCPCSRATVDELSKLLTHCQGKLTATVVMIQPTGTPDGWDRTDLWSSAAAIPGVTLLSDPGGVETRRFGAATSGQALLYSADGQLLFSGGITESRGHSGDNEGRSLIEALVLHEMDYPLAQVPTTPVFGCPLCSPNKNHHDGSPSCPR